MEDTWTGLKHSEVGRGVLFSESELHPHARERQNNERKRCLSSMEDMRQTAVTSHIAMHVVYLREEGRGEEVGSGVAEFPTLCSQLV
jgi:hypothetical protein